MALLTLSGLVPAQESDRAATASAAPAATEAPAAPAAPAAPGAEPAILVGAGDIANCDVGPGHEATGKLLDDIPGTVFTMGDHAYPKGSSKSFRECYELSWGRHKARTRPSPGNHDYMTNLALPYFEYFGENAGPSRRGYYSYQLGAWHIISLNSDDAASRTSKQVQWLREDLAAHPSACTLAYWHVPVFSSGAHGNDRHMTEVWRVLYEHGVEVVVNGHDHSYERFAPQDPDGNADPAHGIREFVVGTGGGGVYPFGKKTEPNSEVRQHLSYGVIKFTLHPDRYDWEFITAKGQPFSDKGSAACAQPAKPPSTVAATQP